MADRNNSITVRFRLKSSDVFWGLARHTIRTMWFMLLLPIAGAISIVGAMFDRAGYSLTRGCICIVFGAFLFCGLPYLQTRSIMKTPNFGGLMILSASEEGIEFTGEHSTGKIGWLLVKGATEVKHAVLIHMKPVGFQIVPKAQLSQADLETFKKVLRRYAPGRVKLSPD